MDERLTLDGWRARPRWPWLLLPLAGLLALIAWTVPIARVRDLRVEEARVLRPGEPDGSTKPAQLSTPRRIAITFSTPQDLLAFRREQDFGLIYASLSACEDDDAVEREVVTQRAEYWGDDGRVRALPSPTGATNGRSRYRAVFNDELASGDHHKPPRRPAIGTPGGLCFSLGGTGGMWPGLLWTDRVPLKLDAR